MGRHSKGKKKRQLPEKPLKVKEISTSPVEQKCQLGEKPLEGKETSTSPVEPKSQLPEKPLEGMETSTSPIDPKSQLQEKPLQEKEISTSPVEPKSQLPDQKPLQGKEISTSPVEQKCQLGEKPLKGKETATFSVEQKHQLRMKALKGKEISVSSICEKKRKHTEKPLKGEETETLSVEQKRKLREKALLKGKGILISSSVSEQKRKLTEKETSSTSSVKEPKHRRLVEKPLSGKKVLLVEDKKMLRNFATLLLSNHGAIVNVCENGKEAFDLVSKLLRHLNEGHSDQIQIPYDYILMDCEMPVMNGYEATKLIREEEKLYGIRIPIIALTATYHGLETLEEDEKEALSKTKDAGMDLCLKKPVQIDGLLDAITILLKARPKKKMILNFRTDRAKHSRELNTLIECDEPSPKKPLSGKKVLVVEDTTELRVLVTKRLLKLGAIVDVCENGKEAFDRFCSLLRDQDEGDIHSENFPYHCILMDCEMPVLNGYKATKLIREEEEHYGIRIPIIGLTENKLTKEEITATEEVGMDFHLLKPLKIDNLVITITNLPVKRWLV